MSLDPSDAIVVASSFSNMLNLANLAEEVQIAYRWDNFFTMLYSNIGEYVRSRTHNILLFN